jgi:SAM-dependent methyltransferase
MAMDRNPQAAQMADESMVRGLAAQAAAIWPQERELIRRYELPPHALVLDVGCGTGEITGRVAELYPDAHAIGIDLLAAHLAWARERWSALGDRVEFRQGDAYQLEIEDGAADLVLCRHLLQAIPEPAAVLAELVRVTRPGGTVHVLAEDYAMMHFHPTSLDTDDFWRRGPITFAERTGSDLRSGRKIFTELRRLGLEEVRVDFVVVDTVRVPREVFADIWVAWRDGYADTIGTHSDLTPEEARAGFETMIACIRDPDGYGVWQVPVISGLRL